MTSPAYSQDAFEMIKGMLAEWGLASLSDVVEDMLIEGVSRDVVVLRLRDSEPYKKRFAGNVNRVKNGLPPLPEADYLAAESAMKTVLRRYGGEGSRIGDLDTQDQITQWISKDVSPQELNDRFAVYRNNYVSKPQWVKDAWAQHGLTPWQAMMTAADPAVSETDLTRKLNTFSVGAEALQAYGTERFDFQSDRFADYADRGLDGDDVREGFANVAGREEREGFLANISGTELGREEQEASELFGDSEATAKRRQVLEREKGRFDQNFLGGLNALAGSAQGEY